MSDEPLDNEETTGSNTPDTPSEPPESPINADTPVPVESQNEPIPSEPINTALPDSASNGTSNLPVEPIQVSEPVSVPSSSEAGTDQISRNEPLSATQTTNNHMQELQAKEQTAIRNKKQKKLDQIINLFSIKSKITNDEVEKLLHVSDATAARYLSILEKEGIIKQSAKTGKGVSYSKL